MKKLFLIAFILLFSGFSIAQAARIYSNLTFNSGVPTYNYAILGNYTFVNYQPNPKDIVCVSDGKHQAVFTKIYKISNDEVVMLSKLRGNLPNSSNVRLVVGATRCR